VNRAVFLDRDGVINVSLRRGNSLHAPLLLDDVVICPGVPEALASLKRAGFLLIVVTNQPDVARGVGRREDVAAIHAYMKQTLPLDAIRVCFHVDADRCACRKPQPGMLLAEATDREIRLDRSFMVGDRWRDIEAGIRAGCRTILVESGVVEEKLVHPDWTTDSLANAAEWILAEPHEGP
jgi:D-glycero-D-manno-heptose 1,7-bisphosphate phosphatase